MISHNSLDQKSKKRLPRLTSRGWQTAFLIWRLWERICFLAQSNCWQNPVPCIYRTKVPISLQALSWGKFSTSRVNMHFLAHGPSLHLQLSLAVWVYVMLQISLCLSLSLFGGGVIISLSDLCFCLLLLLKAHVITLGLSR